jgi:hypothetical protein
MYAVVQRGAQEEVKLSIIVCCYNRPMLLLRLLDSITRQEDKRHEIILANDNSEDDRVAMLAKSFVSYHGGIYAESKTTTEDRLTTVRYAAIPNELKEIATGDIIAYWSDDYEIADPKLFGNVLNFFEANPDINVGYTGCGFRMANRLTGQVYIPEEVKALRLAHGITEELVFEGDGLKKFFSPQIPYGEKLSRVFAVLDPCQFFVRKNCMEEWPEDAQYWMGADAYGMQKTVDLHGAAYPIGNPKTDVPVYSNINDSSLTIRGSVEEVLAVLSPEKKNG